MVIKHNVTALNANRNLNTVTGKQKKDTEKLSSGYRINRAADDAAGLAISEKMRRQIRGLTQASLNAQDGISFVQTAEGALNEVHDILQRANELSVKAAQGTLSADDRDYIYEEIKQLNTEIDRIARDTSLNEISIFDSSNASSASGRIAEDFSDIIFLDADYVSFDMQDFAGAIREAAAAGKTFTQDGLAAFAEAIRDTYMPTLLGDIVSVLPQSAQPTVNGLQISLKMYYENDSTLAYVSSNGVSFQLGVNLKYLTETNGNIGMTADLATTIAHEMTHAVMFDATTNGMLGTRGADQFPSWFVEGTAQAVGGAINYCQELTNIAMNQGDAAIQRWLSRLTDTSDPYNAYAQGYIASMYLGYLAGGSGGVNASTIARGLDKVLKDIEDGYSLSQAIYKETNGKYEDLADFEESFARDAVDFTKELVNAIGNGTGSIASVNGLSGDKDSLLQGNRTSNYFILNVDQSDHYRNDLQGRDTYTGGGATTTSGIDRNGNENADAEGQWGSSSDARRGTVQRSGNIFVQVGAEVGQHITFGIYKLSANDLGVGDAKTDSAENAGKAINKYKKAIQCVSAIRSEYGSVQNRLEHTIANLDNTIENTQAAESLIRDADVADLMMEYSVNNILMQAGVSMLTQANQSKQIALSLLNA